MAGQSPDLLVLAAHGPIGWCQGVSETPPPEPITRCHGHRGTWPPVSTDGTKITLSPSSKFELAAESAQPCSHSTAIKICTANRSQEHEHGSRVLGLVHVIRLRNLSPKSYPRSCEFLPLHCASSPRCQSPASSPMTVTSGFTEILALTSTTFTFPSRLKPCQPSHNRFSHRCHKRSLRGVPLPAWLFQH